MGDRWNSANRACCISYTKYFSSRTDYNDTYRFTSAWKTSEIIPVPEKNIAQDYHHLRPSSEKMYAKTGLSHSIIFDEEKHWVFYHKTYNVNEIATFLALVI